MCSFNTESMPLRHQTSSEFHKVLIKNACPVQRFFYSFSFLKIKMPHTLEKNLKCSFEHKYECSSLTNLVRGSKSVSGSGWRSGKPQYRRRCQVNHPCNSCTVLNRGPSAVQIPCEPRPGPLSKVCAENKTTPQPLMSARTEGSAATPLILL